MAIHFKRTTTIPTDLLLQLRYDEEHGPEFTELRVTHLPAEWYPQCAVQLTWPHAGTDWAPVLKEVTRCYIQMAMQIASREKLLIVTPEPDQVKALLTELPSLPVPMEQYGWSQYGNNLYLAGTEGVFCCRIGAWTWTRLCALPEPLVQPVAYATEKGLRLL